MHVYKLIMFYLGLAKPIVYTLSFDWQKAKLRSQFDWQEDDHVDVKSYTCTCIYVYIKVTITMNFMKTCKQMLTSIVLLQ